MPEMPGADDEDVDVLDLRACVSHPRLRACRHTIVDVTVPVARSVWLRSADDTGRVPW